MCAQKQKRQHFYAKTSAELYIYIGVGARDLYIDEAHTALDIFRFAVFFINNLLSENILICPSVHLSTAKSVIIN